LVSYFALTVWKEADRTEIACAAITVTTCSWKPELDWNGAAQDTESRIWLVPLVERRVTLAIMCAGQVIGRERKIRKCVATAQATLGRTGVLLAKVAPAPTTYCSRRYGTRIDQAINR